MRDTISVFIGDLPWKVAYGVLILVFWGAVITAPTLLANRVATVRGIEISASSEDETGLSVLAYGLDRADAQEGVSWFFFLLKVLVGLVDAALVAVPVNLGWALLSGRGNGRWWYFGTFLTSTVLPEISLFALVGYVVIFFHQLNSG